MVRWQVNGVLWKATPVVVKRGIEEPLHGDGGPESVLRQEMSLFDKPSRGTSMDEFREMLHGFLKVLLCRPSVSPPRPPHLGRDHKDTADPRRISRRVPFESRGQSAHSNRDGRRQRGVRAW